MLKPPSAGVNEWRIKFVSEGEFVAMPQMNKGGKYVFGKSLIRKDGSVFLPPMALREYDITCEHRVYLFTGSKSTGGFCVTRKGLLLPSKLGHILTENPGLLEYALSESEFVRYKGRAYCWMDISADGVLRLSPKTLSFLNLETGMNLLSIRSSDIAFTMGARGPLFEREKNFTGKIDVL